MGDHFYCSVKHYITQGSVSEQVDYLLFMIQFHLYIYIYISLRLCLFVFLFLCLCKQVCSSQVSPSISVYAKVRANQEGNIHSIDQSIKNEKKKKRKKQRKRKKETHSIDTRKRKVTVWLAVKPQLQSRRTTLHANDQTERLTEEALAGLHGPILLHFKLEEAEDGGGHDEEFHLGDVAADAGAGARAEGDEGGLLAGGQTGGIPALGNELLGVGAPDLGGAVDGVAGDGDDVAGVEDVAGDGDGRAAGGDLAGEAHGGGAVDAHGFPDDPLEAGDEVSDMDVGGDGGRRRAKDSV